MTTRSPAGPRVRPAAAAVVTLLSAYKVLISPLFTGCCRFEPSCSDYMRQAVVTHGVVRGLWLGLRRLARCHPFGGYGVDPCPPSP
ncbi:MAG TPA: membrane protein insertion efficiency factor YidD [Actinomycetota bacterium]|nr:membrane protein insertion efficiency factor YidD [Actinomycetota bacterium]